MLKAACYAITLSVCMIGLTGCSQKVKDVSEVVKVATLGYSDVAITQQQVDALPYAAIQFKWGHGPRVLSALAFAEGEQLKWVTQDKAMVVTQHGRLVSTVGFSHNITYTANLESDPLPHLLTLWQNRNAEGLRWSTEHDWQPGYYSGYQALSRFSYHGKEQVIILNKPVTLIKFTEHVSYTKLDVEQQNQFWLSPITGKVIKSKQFVGPGLPAIEMTLLKPFS